MKRLKLIAFVLLAVIGAPTAAQAFDIPLLTWERGREQQVVLGGGAYTQKWDVTLEGNNQPALAFTSSQKNAAGYVVYSVVIPADFELGSYSIVTNGAGSPRTIVAGVNIIPSQTNTAATNLFDLTLIISIFIFLTGIVSTIRARKYSYIPFQTTQLLDAKSDQISNASVNIWDRLEAAPYRLRIQSLNSLQPSLMRFLFIREGELVHRLSPQLYGLTPIIGLISGVVVGIESVRNHGLPTTSMTIFLIVAAIAIFDGLAGVSATLGFWMFELLTGRISSVRDLLIALAIGVAWVGPSLFAALLRETVSRDFKVRSIRGQDPMWVFGIVGSSVIGAGIFYFGHSLVNSVIYTEHPTRSITVMHLIIVAIALIGRGVADRIVLSQVPKMQSRDEAFIIARISSPLTSIVIFFMTFGFVYIWTESASRAGLVALLFTLPYLLIFIRFNKVSFMETSRIPRNILLESAIIAGISFVIFRQISLKPLLLDQRAELLLLLTGVAPVAHAVFSAIYSSNEEKFSFDENPEIIKP